MVYVLDTNKRMLEKCSPARARKLLRAGKAAVYCKDPFTIILNRAVEDPQPHSFWTGGEHK